MLISESKLTCHGVDEASLCTETVVCHSWRSNNNSLVHLQKEIDPYGRLFS